MTEHSRPATAADAPTVRPLDRRTADDPSSDESPVVLYVCVHNAGRSQMAAAYTRALSNGRVQVRSGGTTPAEAINPVVVAAMAEDGVDLTHEQPHGLDAETVDQAHVIVTMGCDDDSPLLAGRRTIDWPLADPAGLAIEDVRPIRDEIRDRVRWLLAELGSLAEESDGSASDAPGPARAGDDGPLRS